MTGWGRGPRAVLTAPPPRRNAIKNPKFRQALVDIVKEAGLTDGCSKTKGNLLYYVASKVRRRSGRQRPTSPHAPRAAARRPADAALPARSTPPTRWCTARACSSTSPTTKSRWALGNLLAAARRAPGVPCAVARRRIAAHERGLWAARCAQSNPQLDGAFDYLKKVGATEADAKALEEAGGVGVVVGCAAGCTPHDRRPLVALAAFPGLKLFEAGVW